MCVCDIHILKNVVTTYYKAIKCVINLHDEHTSEETLMGPLDKFPLMLIVTFVFQKKKKSSYKGSKTVNYFISLHVVNIDE